MPCPGPCRSRGARHLVNEGVEYLKLVQGNAVLQPGVGLDLDVRELRVDHLGAAHGHDDAGRVRLRVAHGRERHQSHLTAVRYS